MYSRSQALAKVLKAAIRAPARCAPSAATSHSQRFVQSSPTVPPRRTPRARQAAGEGVDPRVELPVGELDPGFDHRRRVVIARGHLGDQVAEVAREWVRRRQRVTPPAEVQVGDAALALVLELDRRPARRPSAASSASSKDDRSTPERKPPIAVSAPSGLT